MNTLSADMSYRYCGRIFTDEEMSLIRRLIDHEPNEIVLSYPSWSVTNWPGCAWMVAGKICPAG